MGIKKIEDGDQEYTITELVKDETPRGFGIIMFEDRYGQKCSIQDSSLATECAIWFGIDNTGPQLEGPSGQRNEQIGARMHLTQAMVKQILPILKEFAKTGFIANVKLK